MTENELATRVLGLALRIHKSLGPGLLEKSYEECLNYELINANLYFERQKPLPLIYNDVKLETGYRVDFLIENKLIVEIKAVQNIDEIHISQALTYLRLSNCRLALLINFNVVLLKTGIKRLILGQLINDSLTWRAA